MSLQDKLASGKEKAAQQPFQVEILETLRMVVPVNARDADEAEQIVRNAYGRAEHVLDSSHHIGTDFLAEPVTREHSRGGEGRQGGNHAMNEHTNVSSAAPAGVVILMENAYVAELFSILQSQNKDTSGLEALFGHVKGMEDFVRQAESRIADMKSQLDSMREIQNHPVKTKLQRAIKALETKVAQVKEQIAELKTSIIAGCKEAVTAFKENGISALDKLASFFHIKGGLRAINNDLVESVNRCDKTLADINAFATEFHRAGHGLKNMARMAVGKKPIDAQKEAGKLARAVSAPYKAEKTCLLGIKKAVTAAIGKMEQLEQSAETGRSTRAASPKPKLTDRINAHKERIKAQERDRPVPERKPKTQEALV